MKKFVLVLGVLLMAAVMLGQTSEPATASKVIPPKAKVFISSMPDGFASLMLSSAVGPFAVVIESSFRSQAK